MFQALPDHSQQQSPVLLFSYLKTKPPISPFWPHFPCQLLLISQLLFAAKHLNKNFLYLMSPVLFSRRSIIHHARETALVKITKSFVLPVFLCLKYIFPDFCVASLLSLTEAFVDPWSLLSIPLTLLCFFPRVSSCHMIIMHLLSLLIVLFLPLECKVPKGREFSTL